MKIKRGKQMMALDIGSYSVKIAIGQWAGEVLKVQGTYECILPEGVYENGNILDFDQLKDILVAFLKREKIRVKSVVLTLESSEIIKREMEIDKVDKNDQKSLITYEVTQYLPIDLNAYVIQYKVIEEIETEVNPKLKVLLGAVPKAMAENHFELIKNCGLTPIYMDLHSNAMEKLLNVCMKHTDFDQQTYALINFGHAYTDVQVYEKGVFCFNRLIRMGGNGVTQYIIKHMNLNLTEAIAFKEKFDMANLLERYESQSDYNQDDIMGEDIYEYLKSCFDEIQKIFNYYRTRNHGNDIQQVYIYGGSSSLKGLSEWASDLLNVRAVKLDALSNVEWPVKMGEAKIVTYAPCLGALIRLMDDEN